MRIPRFNVTAARGRRLAGVAVACLLVLVVLVIASPVRQVGVGERGVLYNNATGRVADGRLDSGWHLVAPFVHRLTNYPITAHTYAVARDAQAWLQGQDKSLWVPTSDGQKVNVDAYFTYRLREDRLAEFFLRFDGKGLDQVEREYLDQVFKGALISIVTGNTMDDVYGEGRVRVQDEIRSLVADKLRPLGIDIEIVLLEEVRLTPEAEAVLAAETRRQAAVIEAQGTSQANQLISQSLTDELVRLRSLEKLSADLKVIMVPVTGANILNVPDLLGGAAGSGPGEDAK